MEIIKINGKSLGYGLCSNSYLLISGSFCCVIDPSFAQSEINKVLKAKFGDGIKIVSVILTHCHADHCVALNTYTNAKVYVTKDTITGLRDDKINLASQLWGKKLDILTFKNNLEIIKDGDEINLLPDCVFKIKSTPGHTQDSICIYNNKDIFVGDLIFANGGIGRSDLPTGSAEQIRESIRWIKSLDNRLRVHSGHGDDFNLSEWS